MKKLMILGASILQVPALIEAKSMGFEVIAVDMNKDAIGFQYADVSLVISTTAIDEVIKAALTYEIDGILTIASDRPIRTVATIARKMGLKGISEETATKTTNKYSMRQAFLKAGVAVPEFYLACNYEEFRQAAFNIKHKNKQCIIKPVDNSGSRGVHLLTESSEDELRSIYNYCIENSFCKQIIVEEYMVGPEISVETISIDGHCHILQLTDKITTGAPYFVELGHSQPAQLDKQIQSEIEELVVKANKAVGIKEGPSHTEVILTNEGPKIVEIGARLGGDNITTALVPLSTGINMVKACIQLAIGEKPDLTSSLNNAAAIRYIQCPTGTIKNISGINEASKLNNIAQIEIVNGIGFEMNGIHSSNDRIGFVIAHGNEVKEAVKYCDEAIKQIKIEMV